MEALDDFQDTVEALPIDVIKNLTRIKTIDAESVLSLASLRQLVKSGDKSNIKDVLKQAILLAEQKIQIAATTYDLVDSHVRKLDADFVRIDGILGPSVLAEQRAIIEGFFF